MFNVILNTTKNSLRYYLTFILLTASSVLVAQQQEVSLSSLDLSQMEQPVMQAAADISMTGQRMRIGNQDFSNGINVHAPSKGHVYVGGTAKTLNALVGVDSDKNRKLDPKKSQSLVNTDGSKLFFYTAARPGNPRRLIGVGQRISEIAPGSVEFIVEGDGKVLWKSGIMRQGDAPKPLVLDISGIQMLSLLVTDGKDGNSGDVANWANITIHYTKKKPLIVRADYLSKLSTDKAQFSSFFEPKLVKLPVYKGIVATEDWLIKTPVQNTEVSRVNKNDIVLSNGLTSRTFRISPNVATISLKNLATDEEYIRAIQPEALVMIDSVEYAIGGLGGQVEKGYFLSKWLDEMYALPNAFALKNFEVKNTTEHIRWKKRRWAPTTQWTTKGKELIFYYTHKSKKLKDVTVEVHYELYDNMPLFSKWIVVKNKGIEHTINHFTSEIIAHYETANHVDEPLDWKRPNLYLENEYAFGGFTYEESDQSIFWEKDTTYTSQVNWSLKTPCILKSKPPVGPNKTLGNGENFTSFRTYLMPQDGSDRERNSLAQRKMYRALAPWATENPIFMHLTSTSDQVIKRAIDQCVATGYEMVILSFGSGLNMEDTSAKNIQRYTKWADYAHERGLEMGGYSLFSSRSINKETDVIDIETGKPGGAKFGNAPCAGSEWGINYNKTIKNFFVQTGFDFFEHDGPYPGDFCASTNHPGHKNYYDSQYTQWESTVELYGWFREKGVYMNLPDFYFLSGGNKCGIGYREVNWSLPRAQQILLGRQNIYDGTWTRTPSMGWTFVPLTQYHGGGQAATLEPLSEHLSDYNSHMTQNYGSGVQAFYRGPRLYDTEKTKQVVKANIDHYKKYRDILNADIIHLKRPNGQDWDGIMHIDPKLKTKAFVMLYNPLEIAIKRKIKLPLYYSGLSDKVAISIADKPSKKYKLNRAYEVEVEIEIPAEGNTWLTLE